MKNPPWSDKILEKYWDKIQARVGAEWMPVPVSEDKRLDDLKDNRLSALSSYEHWRTGMFPAMPKEDIEKQIVFWLDRAKTIEAKIKKIQKTKPKGFKEYGTGHYGCVMPTAQKGIVVKVTTDPSEAYFVAAYLSLEPHLRPDGIIPYHKIFAIRTESHRNRPVFVLWRDEAQFVTAGGVAKWIREQARDFERDYYNKSLVKTERELGHALFAGREIRKKVLRKPDARIRLNTAAQNMDPEARPSSLEFQLWKFWNASETMTGEPMGVGIGSALMDMFNHGLILADVHLNNIGMPLPESKIANNIGMIPIITDPGHAIAMTDTFDKFQVEEL